MHVRAGRKISLRAMDAVVRIRAGAKLNFAQFDSLQVNSVFAHEFVVYVDQYVGVRRRPIKRFLRQRSNGRENSVKLTSGIRL